MAQRDPATERARTLICRVSDVPGPCGADAALVVPRWLRPLQRRTSGRGLVPAVDGLRFYAIMAVILYHLVFNLVATQQPVAATSAGRVVGQLFSLGYFGVQMFFVISGFVLGLPFATATIPGRGRVALGAYYLRRLTRLEPPFLLSLAVLFAVRVLLNHATGLWPHLLASAAYAHGFVFGAPSTVSAVTWSLEVEVQFYVLAPLLGRLYRIPGRWPRRLAWALLLCAAQGLESSGLLPAWEHLGHYACYFITGMLLADVFAFDWQEGRSVGVAPWWDAVALAGMVAVQQLLPRQVAPPLVLALLVGLIDYAILRGRWLYRFTVHPVVFTFGGMCYTIYLYHNALIRGLLERTGLHRAVVSAVGADAATVVSLAAALALVTAFSAGLFAAVERPCMNPRWVTELAARIRAPAPREG